MRVAIDVSPLVQTRAGTARYLQALLARNDYQRVSFGGPGRVAAVVRDVWWYRRGIRADAASVGAQLLHCPTFRGPVRPLLPLVVTVHDLAVLRHPEAFNRWTRRYSRASVPRVARAARRLIAVSEFTRREVVELLGVEPDAVAVIGNAVEAPFAAEGPRAEGDYVLAVGTLEPRKNLPRLVEAAGRLGARLVVVGASGWGGVEAQGDGVEWRGEVPDAELAALYRGARCLAYPSLYEGFGIPVLEAMACGTPVVTSLGGATEEVAGGAAVLVDPLDVSAIAAGIEEALARATELRAAGLDRAAAFSWDAAAAATRAVYEEALA